MIIQIEIPDSGDTQPEGDGTLTWNLGSCDTPVVDQSVGGVDASRTA